MLFFIFFTSCIPDPVDVKLKKQSPKLVVNAELIPGKIPLINLTKTVDVLSGIPNKNDTLLSDFLKKIAVSDAAVTINYSSTVDTLYMIEPGIYSGRKPLQASTAPYILHVKDAYSDMEINAQASLLPKIKFETISSLVLPAPGDTSVYINYTFRNSSGISNYYVINYYVKKKTAHQVNFDMQHYFERGYNQLFFSEFLGKEDFYGDAYENLVLLPQGITIRDSIAITISGISEEYYNYLDKRMNSGGFQFFYYFPTYLPSNVVNGLGYFNVHDPDVFLSDLK